MHAVDVGPYLHFACLYHRADYRSRVVRTATAEVIDFALVVAADIAFGNENLGRRLRFYHAVDTHVDIVHVGLAAFECTHVFKRRKHDRLYAERTESTGPSVLST